MFQSQIFKGIYALYESEFTNQNLDRDYEPEPGPETRTYNEEPEPWAETWNKTTNHNYEPEH